jgi:hypothetical protein
VTFALRKLERVAATRCVHADDPSEDVPILITSPGASGIGESIRRSFTGVPFREPWSSLSGLSWPGRSTACLREV